MRSGLVLSAMLLVTMPGVAGAAPRSAPQMVAWHEAATPTTQKETTQKETVRQATGHKAQVDFGSIVPAPVSSSPNPSASFEITDATKVFADPAAVRIACYLAEGLRTATGFALPVYEGAAGKGKDIRLLLTGASPQVGEQGYELEVTADGITIRANRPAGLFAGVQTLRQLLPPAIEASTVQPGPWRVAGGRIVDHPRFAYRGAMLDVARHFFSVAQVKRYLNQLTLYKVNHLHLHLSDDQGWRIAIDKWPRLTTVGGSKAVGGGPGGFYTKADYTEIVNYAADRYITIVPEIDMPGHTNAALASYAELNCNGKARSLYTGMKVGFSTLCVSKPVTYTFIDDVIGELAAITPGPFIHIGGDEAHSTTPADYKTFINRVQEIVNKHGKTMVGFHDVVNADEVPSTVAQFWSNRHPYTFMAESAAKGTRIIMSPANRAYLDMKYTSSTKLGLHWAGQIEVRAAYDWDPGSYLAGVPESSVFGVEAPLWSETIKTNADIEFLAFPRLPALMELAWSPRSAHNWEDFRKRLGGQGVRWKAMGLNYYRSPQVTWPENS